MHVRTAVFVFVLAVLYHRGVNRKPDCDFAWVLLLLIARDIKHSGDIPVAVLCIKKLYFISAVEVLLHCI